MLCRKFKSILFTKTNKNVVYRPVIPSRSFSKWFEIISATNVTTSARFKMFRNIIFKRAFNVWTKSALVSNVVRRYRRERGVKDILQYFRQRYISDLDTIEQLSKATLFCEGCDKRIIIDTQHTGIRYCECPNSSPVAASYDGWMPYMETSDVIIWRKEYKPGGLFAYKVYGRYKHIHARDFALIQVDSAYRPEWDDAVASISTVEKHANGVHNQYIVHWEVLWPRLFTNRDYVYIRRHKEYTVERKCLSHKDAIFPDGKPCAPVGRGVSERPSGAKQAAQEKDEKEQQEKVVANAPKIENNVYVIVSRSCRHPKVPLGSSAVRVNEYWSHMVVTSLNGPDQPGMEFVLTYYDEPAVGGMPTSITSWAMGRAGPAFMQKMRAAAEHYHKWKRTHPHQDTPDFSPEPATVDHQVSITSISEAEMESIQSEEDDEEEEGEENEQEQEESPNRVNVEVLPKSREQSTQTRPVNITLVDGPHDVIVSKVIIAVKEPYSQGEIDSKQPIIFEETKEPQTPSIVESLSDIDSQEIVLKEVINKDAASPIVVMEQDRDSVDNVLEKDSNNQEKKTEKVRWWWYLYPFYYFV